MFISRGERGSRIAVAFPTRTDIIISKHGNYNLSLCNNIERTQFMALALMVRLLLHVIYYYYFGPNNTSNYTLHKHACRFAKNVSDNNVRHDIFPDFCSAEFFATAGGRRIRRMCALRFLSLHFFICCHLSTAHSASALKLLPKTRQN